jgi:uncharacterized membrane protein
MEVLEMSAEIYGPHKSSIGGMDANVMALIAYIGASILSFIPGVKYVAWLFPIVLFFVEKTSSFVKFHAVQAFLMNTVGAILGAIFGGIATAITAAAIANAKNLSDLVATPFFAVIFGGIALIIGLIILVFSILAMVGAYQYKLYQVPVIGKLAVSIAAKLGAQK